MIGSLNVGERRLLELVRRHGVERYREIKDAIKDYSERRMRAAIGEIPDGIYVADELHHRQRRRRLTSRPASRVEVTVDGDRVVADFTGSDPQRRGPATRRASRRSCAVYNAMLHLTDPDIPSTPGATGRSR